MSGKRGGVGRGGSRKGRAAAAVGCSTIASSESSESQFSSSSTTESGTSSVTTSHQFASSSQHHQAAPESFESQSMASTTGMSSDSSTLAMSPASVSALAFAAAAQLYVLQAPTTTITASGMSHFASSEEHVPSPSLVPAKSPSPASDSELSSDSSTGSDSASAIILIDDNESVEFDASTFQSTSASAVVPFTPAAWICCSSDLSLSNAARSLSQIWRHSAEQLSEPLLRFLQQAVSVIISPSVQLPGPEHVKDFCEALRLTLESDDSEAFVRVF
jgi:hypothetical protein